MDNFEHLSQEELLEAAQKAYEEQTQNAVPTKDAPCEEEHPTVEEPALEQDESIVAEEEPAQEELEEAPSLPATVSTNGTALGIAAGLIFGAGVGFITGKVAACLTIGVLLGVLIGLFLDLKKDKKANAPEPKEEIPAPTILEDTIQEDE